jgi:hypothetical protein
VGYRHPFPLQPLLSTAERASHEPPTHSFSVASSWAPLGRVQMEAVELFLFALGRQSQMTCVKLPRPCFHHSDVSISGKGKSLGATEYFIPNSSFFSPASYCQPMWEFIKVSCGRAEAGKTASDFVSTQFQTNSAAIRTHSAARQEIHHKWNIERAPLPPIRNDMISTPYPPSE